MAKDNWEKFQIIGGVLAGVLVPIAIFLAGLAISSADRDNAQIASQAQRLTELIDHLSSDNKKEQLIAVEVANYLAETKQLPDVLVPSLTRIATHSEDSETAQAATQAVIRFAEQDSKAAQTVKQAFSNISPRVYFHISLEKQRQKASEIERLLENEMKSIGLIVPGIELRPGPQKTELRYFKRAERAEAQSIVDALSKFGVSAKLVDLSTKYENSTGIRPRHYELWIGRNA